MKRILTFFWLMLAMALGAAPASSTVSRSVMEVSNIIVAPQFFWPTQVFSVPFSNAVNAVVTNHGGGGSSTGGVAVVSGTNIIITTNGNLATISAAVGTNSLFWRTNFNNGITNTGGDVIVKSGTFQVGSGHVFFQDGTAALDNGNITMGASSFNIRTNGAADVDTFLTDGSVFMGGGILSYKFWLDTLGGVTITNLAGIGNRFVQADANGKLTASLSTSILVSSATNRSPVITVSSRGITNGLSSLTNNGMMFGPDTPGTATCGLKEAYDSIPKGVIQGPTAAGSEIKLSGGYFYFTNELTFSNEFTFGIKITGETLLNTKLVYAGSNAGVSTITISGGGNPTSSIDLPMHVVIRDVGFSAINNLTNILLRITNYSHAEISDCNFTGWQIMTNTDWGSGMSINAPTIRGNSVGLVIGNVAEHGTFLHDNYFAGLADGLYLLCDHAYVTGLKFANIGYDESLLHTTAWSTDSPYSIGAGILRRPGLNSHYADAHFYATHIGLALLNNATGDDQVLDRIESEGTDFDIAVQNPATAVIKLNAPSWDGTTAKISTSPYSVASSNLTLIVQQATYVTNGNTTIPVLHTSNAGIRYWDKVSLSSEVKNKLPTGSLDYNSSGSFVNGILSFPVVDLSQGDIAQGSLTDDSHGNVYINGSGGYIIRSNSFPFSSWAVLTNSACITWMSNNVLYLVCTNSISGTASTNQIVPTANTTSIAGTNIDNYYTAFPSATNTLTLNNGYWLYNAAGDCSVTNVAGQSANKVMWATLAVSNASASAINFRMTGGLSIRPQGLQTTNNVVLASGKMAIFSAISFGTLNTNYCNTSQQ